VTVPALVGHDDMVARLHQWLHLMTPRERVLWPAVTQHNGLSSTGAKDFQFHAVNRDHLRLGKINHLATLC